MRAPLLAALLFAATPLLAQQPAAILPPGQIHTQPELEQTIRALDTQLFNAYNHCAEPGFLDQFAALFTPDVEFYHDQGGSTFGIAPLTTAIGKSICGKVTRQLVPASFRVFPMKDLGAIEFGTHRFFHPTDATAPSPRARLTLSIFGSIRRAPGRFRASLATTTVLLPRTRPLSHLDGARILSPHRTLSGDVS